MADTKKVSLKVVRCESCGRELTEDEKQRGGFNGWTWCFACGKKEADAQGLQEALVVWEATT